MYTKHCIQYQHAQIYTHTANRYRRNTNTINQFSINSQTNDGNDGSNVCTPNKFAIWIYNERIQLQNIYRTHVFNNQFIYSWARKLSKTTKQRKIIKTTQSNRFVREWYEAFARLDRFGRSPKFNWINVIRTGELIRVQTQTKKRRK